MLSIFILYILIHQTVSGSVVPSDHQAQHVIVRRNNPIFFTVPLHYRRYNLYLAQVGFGTDPQTFLLLPDSGSSAIWVASKGSPHEESGFDKVYDAELSSTHKTTGIDFSEEYTKGKVGGLLSKDNLLIGGMLLPDVLFGETIHSESWGNKEPFQGIIGLQHTSDNSKFPQTFLDTLLANRMIDRPVFSLNYCRIMFGDEILCLDCRVVVDSGHSLNSAPEAQTRLINRQFLFAREDEGLFYLNCANKRKGRPITLVFSEDAQFALDDYFLEADYGAHSVCFSAYTFHKAHDFWVFGVDILQYFSTVFDAEKKRIGFAKREC
ncbi:hypothetical protein CRM22_000176 [Opisthorchis felineus]|uniref:Peptidase A1 domain-containing protein n=1 Tax=Opisthorchis felineus TaxID=147828 RepID=A0A4S2MG78_OPIFE|nr:hypothetical protein CRM22_000176 [Opisthorchis felineus]